ncbi:Uncharacterized protein PBTT_09269 [Plasmodiophora brassicae]|uniref:Uncharacterized protein n=1 Tax=Plasmodiophora brassicae TaxID=37360 RepID=A0A0G4IPI4_PLABS|nr:hypothetical protein PBRA_005716 [Plasmodiophora brassicae]
MSRLVVVCCVAAIVALSLASADDTKNLNTSAPTINTTMAPTCHLIQTNKTNADGTISLINTTECSGDRTATSAAFGPVNPTASLIAVLLAVLAIGA